MPKLKYLDKLLPDLFLHKRLLMIALVIVFLFCMGFPYPVFYALGKWGLLLISLALLIDAILLFRIKQPITGTRTMEAKLSNGDHNPVVIQLEGLYNFKTHITVIDEFPVQLQLRDQQFVLPNCAPYFKEEISYEIRPTERGEYFFGDTRVFVSSPLALIKRRITLPTSTAASVYPSFIQLRKYAFLTISNRLEEVGVKKIRYRGASNEFEQIREYVRGDDFRIINWKATARRSVMMVNEYQDEKAQNVYCLIDKGRLMHTPFDGLSLIDYAINSTLVLSNVAISRGDKVGLITFSDKIGSFIQAQSLSSQMNKVSEALYNQDVRLKEADYLRLYKNVKVQIKKRSLLILFTNFDSLTGLRRQMKYLRAIAKDHLLFTVIFDNREINERANTRVDNIIDSYQQTIAEKFQHDKRQIIKELKNNGIYSLLTEPQDLTVNAINKYIELKARRAI